MAIYIEFKRSLISVKWSEFILRKTSLTALSDIGSDHYSVSWACFPKTQFISSRFRCFNLIESVSNWESLLFLERYQCGVSFPWPSFLGNNGLIKCSGPKSVFFTGWCEKLIYFRNKLFCLSWLISRDLSLFDTTGPPPSVRLRGTTINYTHPRTW